MVDVEKGHQEPTPGKDLPQLSAPPGSARATETHFARLHTWSHAQAHSR